MYRDVYGWQGWQAEPKNVTNATSWRLHAGPIRRFELGRQLSLSYWGRSRLVQSRRLLRYVDRPDHFKVGVHFGPVRERNRVLAQRR